MVKASVFIDPHERVQYLRDRITACDLRESALLEEYFALPFPPKTDAELRKYNRYQKTVTLTRKTRASLVKQLDVWKSRAKHF